MKGPLKVCMRADRDKKWCENYFDLQIAIMKKSICINWLVGWINSIKKGVKGRGGAHFIL